MCYATLQYLLIWDIHFWSVQGDTAVVSGNASADEKGMFLLFICLLKSV